MCGSTLKRQATLHDARCTIEGKGKKGIVQCAIINAYMMLPRMIRVMYVPTARVRTYTTRVAVCKPPVSFIEGVPSSSSLPPAYTAPSATPEKYPTTARAPRTRIRKACIHTHTHREKRRGKSVCARERERER